MVVKTIGAVAELLYAYGIQVARNGFEELALALAARLGASPCTLLARSGKGREQKTLNAKERAENLKGAFRVVGDPTGRCVLLVDDLVTTGAGMSVATRALLRAGAAGVIAVSAAYTPKKK